MNIRDKGIKQKYLDAKEFVKWYETEYNEVLRPKNNLESKIWELRERFVELNLSGFRFRNLDNAIKQKYHKRVLPNGEWYYESANRKSNKIH